MCVDMCVDMCLDSECRHVSGHVFRHEFVDTCVGILVVASVGVFVVVSGTLAAHECNGSTNKIMPNLSAS